MSSGGFPKIKRACGRLATLLIGSLLQCVATAAALSLCQLPDIATAEDTPSQAGAVRVTGGGERRPVSFAVKSSNPHLVPEANVQFREWDVRLSWSWLPRRK